jgi:hypothetical protein
VRHDIRIPDSSAPVSLPDQSSTRLAFGLSGGADIVVGSSRRVSFLATARLRWVRWRALEEVRDTHTAVPPGAGRLSFIVGGGLRVNGRRKTVAR